MIKIKLCKWQNEVSKDEHRFRIICAGRRSGKSVLARMIVLKWACETPGVYYIVSPTYKQAKSIHWNEIRKEIPRKYVKSTNATELSLTLFNGSIIELKGAENPDALRGVKLHGLVIDEIASIRNWEWLWAEVLRPTLTDFQSPAIFISTPKGYNHFYELYELGQSGVDDYKSWKFTSYRNPYIPKAELDKAKEELTEDTFAQEYLADFRKFTGLVYKDFDRATHVIEPFEITYPTYTLYRSMDFGTENPTVCLWIAVDFDDNVFVVDEYYERSKTIDYHSGVISANPLSKMVKLSYCDPNNSNQWVSEFSLKGVYLTPATKEKGIEPSWVRFGIEKVQNKLKPMPGRMVEAVKKEKHQSLPSLFVFNTCINTIKEFETYRWREKSVTQAQDLNEPDVPEKANDHAMDALRYFIVSYGKRLPIEGIIPPKKNWSIG